jgi:glycosyltransferase involved in cell wall biosynthesis
MEQRVLHVMTRYLRGGSEKRLHDMVNAFPQARHELIVGDDSLPAAARREIGLASIWVVPTLVRQPSPVADLQALASIWRVMRKISPDLVVTHQSKAGVLGRLSARWLRVPSVSSLSMANFGPGYPSWQSRVFSTLERALHPSTSAYAVVGRDLARRYEKIGVPPAKLRVVRSGVRLPVDGDRMIPSEEIRRRLGIPHAARLIAYLGSLEPRKNVLDLVPLLSGVREKMGASPFLVIAGEGPLEGELSRSIRSRGLTRDAALVGFLEAPLSLIAEADVVVLLSQAEGVSQVLVQAAALDTPFVAYHVDGVDELLEMGARGRAVPIGDVGAAADATAEILGWPGTPAAPSIDLTDWSASTIRHGYLQLFSSVLGARTADVPG